jgi:hypothetical protein
MANRAGSIGDAEGVGGVKESVEHRDVGLYRFTVYVVPEGDHWRWQVNRTKLGSQFASRWGEPLPGGTGTASWGSEAKEKANAFLRAYLKNHPDGA